MSEYLSRLRTGQSLTESEAALCAAWLARDDVPQADRKALLLALAEKGETPEEVTGFASAFRSLARDPGLADYAERAVDIVGTGGDAAGTFNISTASAFLVAATGVPVLKHGNRSITSRSGSADLIAALGIPLEADAATLRRSLQELNFAFLFAPAFHPAFKNIMPVRKELAAEGRRTIFNILGPLINPARPAAQLLGVFSQKWVQPLAEALGRLGLRRALVVHGVTEDGRGLDELTVVGTNHCAGAGDCANMPKHLPVQDYGLTRGDFAQLLGGDPADNLALLHRLARNTAPEALRESILLNAGVALWLARAEPDIASGIHRVRDSLEQGALLQWLEKARQFSPP